VTVEPAQDVDNVTTREVGEQLVFGIDASLVMFDKVLNQEMLVCVDELSHVLVLPSEATNVASGKVLNDR
jgi:hypothetical protein